ncbi:MAG: hypothetical protein VB070_12370 [Clostridiaceae bacterium]|nr:hypothetical protein [Clostridiaceae bacterium]
MNFRIILEAMKFYKIRRERVIQIWFILLYAINLLVFVLPIGDRDFSRLFDAFTTLTSGDLNVQPAWELLTPGNWLLIGLSFLVSLITLFFSYLYAVYFIGEQDDMTPGQAVVRCLRKIPAMLAVCVVLLLPALMSACFAFIPLIIFLFMMYFLPLDLALENRPLLESIRYSYEMTRHKKLIILVEVALLSLAVTIPQNIILNLISGYDILYYALASFFVVIRAFMQGRMMGILYLFLVKKVPDVIPSKPNEQM